MPKKTTNHSNLKSDLFFNRELSWLQFNLRVLEEAEDHNHPILERLKFIAIFSSNLDEFFMVRVAGIKEQIESELLEISSDGKTPLEQLAGLRAQLLPLVLRQTAILMNDVLPSLEREGVHIHPFAKLNQREKDSLCNTFCEDILPVLTPLALDTGHPFPRLLNRSLNLAFVLRDETRDKSERKTAVLQLPPLLRRFVPLKRTSGNHFVLLEQIIQAHAEILFPGLTVEDSYPFRVTRDADLEIADDEASDLLTEVAEQVRLRRWGTAAVRLEVEEDTPEYLVNLLMNSLELEPNDVYHNNRPLNLPDFMELMKIDRRELKDIPFNSRQLPEFQDSPDEIFEAIRKHDIMVHHPFDSFTNSVVKFLNAAADDPKVLAIKITLYRAGGSSSPVIEALKRAAENGKQITAFVELKARFDEENNIIWAKELEQEGVHVVYGVLGLKTHTKIAMVVRKEKSSVRTYLHLATGNYNLSSSRTYTDIGMFTAREEFGNDAIHLFNSLTGYSHYSKWEEFIVAPGNLRSKVIHLIRREAELHTPEKPGHIMVKMNALVDDDVIRELYRAGQKGVKIQLLVRGICCLRPGLESLSETIEVRSILGRFLEHSRIFYFANGGEPEFYLASADWMPRNFVRRVELMFPIYESRVCATLEHILAVYWADNTKSRQLLPDGSYRRLIPQKGESEFSAQQFFLNEIVAGGRRPLTKMKRIIPPITTK
ncbi:MAG: polyphosphate kinase 1 [Bacteroidetes bacterium]|nr:polyphosphate kinase 1 [Bacteroidota bacterium]